ncbi:MAG TPA: hypothetical protein VHY35_09995 [Stellaceae bacterium]|jgi:hypothetical protein|nr:hypothetical protein [Stellaceae bacterium]
MQGHDHTLEDAIINDAYAEKVREAFRIFADNIATGQGEKACKDRFVRALEIVKRARDMAIEAMNGVSVVEPTEFSNEAGDGPLAKKPTPLSPEDEAMIKAVVGESTGLAAPKPLYRR